jgi:tetratricopeptide (TPR) repeat protein
MKKLNSILITLIYLLLVSSCATTKSTIDLINTNNSEQAKTYSSHPVNISLEDNKELLGQLENDLITFDKYDSLLTQLGRPPIINFLFEKCICSTNNPVSFDEAVRAEYHINTDSLTNIVKERMNIIIESDSTYIMPYILLSIIDYNESNLAGTVQFLDKIIFYSKDFDNTQFHVIKAEFLVELHNYDEAINEYEIICAKSVINLQNNWRDLFALYLQLDFTIKAKNLWQEAEKLSSNTNFKKENLDMFVKLLWKEKDYTKLMLTYETQRDSLNSDFIDNELFNLLVRQNKFAGAEKHLLNLVSIDFNWNANPKLTFPVFDSLTSHNTEIKNKLKTMIDTSLNNLSANFCYGYLLISQELNKNDQNINNELIRKGLALLKRSDTSNSEINYLISYILLELENPHDALDYLSNVQIQSKYYPYSLVNRAIVLSDNDLTQAISFLKKAQKLLPSESKLIGKIGDYYFNSENYSNAIDWYIKYLEHNPDNFQVEIDLTRAYIYSDKFSLALSQINNVIETLSLKKDDWLNNWYTGHAYETKGDINLNIKKWTDAKQNYEKSINYIPLNMSARFSLAEVYYKLNDNESAKETYLSIIATILNENTISTYKKEYKQALENLIYHNTWISMDSLNIIEVLEKAIEYFHSEDWCYRNLGSAYSKQDNYHKAYDNLKKAIEINPNHYLNFSFYAYFLRNEEQYEKAIINYNKAIEILENLNDESKLTIIGNLTDVVAEIYQELDEIDLAIISYKKAILLTSGARKENIRFKLANMYFLKKEFSNAIENWEIVYKETKGHGAKFNIAISYYNLGGSENLKKSKNCFLELETLLMKDTIPTELLTDVNNWLNIISNEIESADWIPLVEKLVNSKNSVVSNIAQIYKLTDSFREVNNLWIEGIAETTPVYSKSGDYITDYNVSSKIFQAEHLCDRLKSKLLFLNVKDEHLEELISLWTSSLDIRKEGIKLHSKGFYIKAKDYSGEYERGKAKINIANQYYADGLIILQKLMQNNIKYFSRYGVESINYLIEYYKMSE